MAPRVRKPLAVTSNPAAKDQLKQQLIDIFDKSQYCTSCDLALTQLRKVYNNTTFSKFEPIFKDLFKRFLQSKNQSNYFKTTCDFICKFLEQQNKNNETTNNDKTTIENKEQNPKESNNKRTTRKGVKRKERDSSDDELVSEYLQTSQASQMNVTDEDLVPITDHDRLISSCIDVADLFMQTANEDCRFNAVYFVCKFLTYIQSLDEEIFKALQERLTERIRDKKPRIRAQAVLASHTLQANKMIQDAFVYHFYRDPELVVRKALLQVMDTKIFGYNFLADSTQDSHEFMRVSTYQRIGKVSPKDLTRDQLHKILHNGLNERERRANYAFKTNTLEVWLASLYDGLDLQQLLDSFDCIEYHDDICKLLHIIYERDLDKIENNGTSTKLHHVVENFRENNFDDNCIPRQMSNVDEKLIIIWTSLVKFCRTNQSLIKSVKLRAMSQANDRDNSIEKILDEQEKTDDVVEVFERLTPDLINLVNFLKNFVEHAHKKIGNCNDEKEITKFEFIYQHIMDSILSYDIGDELERKSVQDVLGGIIKENLLTGHFKNFIPPLIKCLYKLIYSTSTSLMLNYISELINNVRSHLEDVITGTTQSKTPAMQHSTIINPNQKKQVPKSAKKVRIEEPFEGEDLECEIAHRRVELEELKDELDLCIKDKDYDKAKTIDGKMRDIKTQLNMLHERRYSIASDISHMSMVIDTDPSAIEGKLSSTVIANTSLNDSEISIQNEEEVKIFKHHTNELVKCLQMYFACLQNLKIKEVPQTMLNHLNLLSYECLDEWFKENTRVRSLMVACNGLTALIDKRFANVPNTLILLMAACFDNKSIEVKTAGFKSLVDVIIEHEDLDYSHDNIEKFLNLSLRDYGKFNSKDSTKDELEFATAVVEGTSKLFYYKKLSSPKILSHFILWWYHPKTDSKLRQFIGVFLPLFVRDSSKKQLCTEENNDTWLKDLLEDTFVMSIELLHNYITGPGINIMEASDMLSLINFLCNLIPIAFHSDIQIKLDERIDELSNKSIDLVKYLKQAKNSLTSSVTINNDAPTPLARRIDTTIVNN